MDKKTAQIKKLPRGPLAHFESTFTGFEGEWEGGPRGNFLFESYTAPFEKRLIQLIFSKKRLMVFNAKNDPWSDPKKSPSIRLGTKQHPKKYVFLFI